MHTMPPLPIMSGKELIKALESMGFFVIRRKGSHVVLRDNKGHRAVVAVHGKKSIPRGTLKGILKDCEIKVKDFCDILQS